MRKTSRDVVYERDQHRCVACGGQFRLTIQHRSNRGMGGSKEKDRLSNLVTMCWTDNTALESDPVSAETGRGFGWKLSQHVIDPAEYPVWYHDEGWFWLDDDGTRTRVWDK